MFSIGYKVGLWIFWPDSTSHEDGMPGLSANGQNIAAGRYENAAAAMWISSRSGELFVGCD
jgi:hypothetical protein